MKECEYMNRLLAVAVAAAIGLNFTCPVQAVEGKGEDRTTGFFVGTISTIELETRTLKVKSATSKMTFVVAEDAKIVGRDSKEESLSDLKVGEEVTVDYAEENGIIVAHRITLTERLFPPPDGDRPLRF